MAEGKTWRIRDAVHNLIEFDGLDPLEARLWKIIQTASFQRLRQIKQLGFSEFVYPGATHTRFAHSIGVFHTARRLMDVIRKFEHRNRVRYEDQHAAPALAAALLHDIGHGMFSHAFEAIGKENGWTMAKHEDVSQILIKKGEIAEILNDYYDGFADNVAEILKDNKDKQIPPNIFHAVVSSQFDADRLDYMQRDRLMTGVRSSQVDVEWLFANLEVGEIQIGQDDESLGTVQTLILGAKAQQTAENYIFSLFHLYPNVYLHKTTRGFEVLFQALIRRLIYLVKNDKIGETGLSDSHPLCKFICLSNIDKNENSESSVTRQNEILTLSQELDDSLFWGGLPFLLQAGDSYVKKCASAFKLRQPLRAIDIRAAVESGLSDNKQWNKEAGEAVPVDKICINIVKRIEGQDSRSDRYILCDTYSRTPYKKVQSDERNSYLNQILIRGGGTGIKDIRDISAAVRNAENYAICRAYVFRDGDEEKNQKIIENLIKEELQKYGG